MAETTLDELIRQRAALDSQIAEKQLEPTKALQTILNRASVKTLVKDVQDALEKLMPGSPAAAQANNVVTVLTAVPGLIDSEVSRLESAVTPPSTEE